MRLIYNNNDLRRIVMPSIDKTLGSLNALINQSSSIPLTSDYAYLSDIQSFLKDNSLKLKKAKNYLEDSYRNYNGLSDLENSEISNIPELVIKPREKIIL